MLNSDPKYSQRLILWFYLLLQLHIYLVCCGQFTKQRGHILVAFVFVYSICRLVILPNKVVCNLLECLVLNKMFIHCRNYLEHRRREFLQLHEYEPAVLINLFWFLPSFNTWRLFFITVPCNAFDLPELIRQ